MRKGPGKRWALLDLAADVDRYVRELRIPRTFSRPITAENLLTHTASSSSTTGT